MSTTRRAVITGIGVISPIGRDPESYLESLLAGRGGIVEVQSFDASNFRSNLGGEIQDLDFREYLSEEEIAEYDDRYLQLALSASKQALAAAGLPDDFGADRRSAVCVGTCNGGLKTAERLYRQLFGLEPGTLDERMNLNFRYFALGRALGVRFNIGGPNLVVTTACAASTNALGMALDLIRSNDVDVALAGGADSLCLTTFAGFSAITAMAEGRSTPFSANKGLNLGEGAAFWVIEELSRAEARGAAILGEVLGYALTSDAYHPTSPDPKGEQPYRAMLGALQDAGLGVEDLGYINAHGTGTEANDLAETRAVRRLLGEREVPVSSTKSFLGHCLGAAGALEATASLLCMREGKVPPTLAFTEPRPGCTLDCVPNHARDLEYSVFVSNSFAFGGNNAALAVGRLDPGREVPALPAGRRVVITGQGAVTPFGAGAAALAAAAREGRCAIDHAARFDTSSCSSHRVGLVPELEWRKLAPRVDLREMHPISRYATLACQEALQTAGLRPGPRTGKDTGLMLGVLVGPNEETLMSSVWGSEDHRADIGSFSVIVANSVNGRVARALYLKGYNTMLSTGHQAGLAAVLGAVKAIGAGHTDAVIAGGTDEVFGRYFANYDAVGYLPADDAVSGYGVQPLPGQQRFLGEGSAVLLLEERERAEARGAKVLAEVLAVALSFDPGPFVSGSESTAGLRAAIEDVLRRAGRQPADVDLVLTARQGNSWDQREQAALEAVFGEDGVPRLASTVPGTGYLESTSAVANCAAWLHDPGPWPGRRALVLGTSLMGNNLVALLERS